MAGIYLHIPFCQSRCIYCDFCSTTRAGLRSRYIRALCAELRLRRGYLRGESVRTIYFGGGTPSQLREEDFRAVFRAIGETYGTGDCEEITLEANPDDLTPAYAGMLRRLPFNRISIGIQTFDDRALALLRRRHDADKARQAVRLCRDAGFDNISIDLIYGLPGETEARWLEDLRQAIALGVEHISAYHLTYEPGTPLHGMLARHAVSPTDEDSSLRFFTLLGDTLRAAGYVHYEISNFCKLGRHSRHNSAYWLGIPYLGCGPSAHSYDRQSREWNTASVNGYIEGMESGNRLYEKETLSPTDRYNEYVMTGLRTCRGISADFVREHFGDASERYLRRMAAPYINRGVLKEEDGRLRLARASLFVSDGIISDLFQ